MPRNTGGQEGGAPRKKGGEVEADQPHVAEGCPSAPGADAQNGGRDCRKTLTAAWPDLDQWHTSVARTRIWPAVLTVPKDGVWAEGREGCAEILLRPSRGVIVRPQKAPTTKG